MYLAPDATLDDGLLDVVLIAAQSKRALPARAAARVPRHAPAGPGDHSCCRAARSPSSADRPFTAYADGDPIAELPVTVRVLPGALRVVAPR